MAIQPMIETVALTPDRDRPVGTHPDGMLRHADQSAVVHLGVRVRLDTQVIGAPEISAPEIGAPEIGAPEIGVPEIGAPEIGAPEIGASEIGAPEIGALAARLRPQPLPMFLKNITQLFRVHGQSPLFIIVAINRADTKQTATTEKYIKSSILVPPTRRPCGALTVSDDCFFIFSRVRVSPWAIGRRAPVNQGASLVILDGAHRDPIRVPCSD
jgi:hypothetical protein